MLWRLKYGYNGTVSIKVARMEGVQQGHIRVLRSKGGIRKTNGFSNNVLTLDHIQERGWVVQIDVFFVVERRNIFQSLKDPKKVGWNIPCHALNSTYPHSSLFRNCESKQKRERNFWGSNFTPSIIPQLRPLRIPYHKDGC